MRQHLRGIPEDLFAAAQWDGTTSMRTLWHVVLPLLWPALGAVATLSFITTRNVYLWPLPAAPIPAHSTIQTGLHSAPRQSLSLNSALGRFTQLSGTKPQPRAGSRTTAAWLSRVVKR